MASDKNHRPCLPLKPQEKVQISWRNIILIEDINFIIETLYQGYCCVSGLIFYRIK